MACTTSYADRETRFRSEIRLPQGLITSCEQQYMNRTNDLPKKCFTEIFGKNKQYEIQAQQKRVWHRPKVTHGIASPRPGDNFSANQSFR